MAKNRHAITNEFINTINSATVTENTLTLNGQMSRKEYTDFMKIAELIGLIWDRKKKCHIFGGDNLPEALQEVIGQGEVVDLKKLFQQYYTPQELAKEAVELADVKENHDALEPSAGKGAIVRELLKVTKNVFF